MPKTRLLLLTNNEHVFFNQSFLLDAGLSISQYAGKKTKCKVNYSVRKFRKKETLYKHLLKKGYLNTQLFLSRIFFCLLYPRENFLQSKKKS